MEEVGLGEVGLGGWGGFRSFRNTELLSAERRENESVMDE